MKQWDHQPEDQRYQVSVKRGGKRLKGVEPERIAYIEEELMYWRKANHIHKWFVENVQNGVDDCATYYVSQDDLSQLLEACKEVMSASELVDGMVYAGTVFDKDHPKGIVNREPGKVIKDATVAAKVLPRQEGFFFGSYEYDEDYLKDVIATRSWAQETLDDYRYREVPGQIIYRSSW